MSAPERDPSYTYTPDGRQRWKPGMKAWELVPGASAKGGSAVRDELLKAVHNELLKEKRATLLKRLKLLTEEEVFLLTGLTGDEFDCLSKGCLSTPNGLVFEEEAVLKWLRKKF